MLICTCTWACNVQVVAKHPHYQRSRGNIHEHEHVDTSEIFLSLKSQDDPTLQHTGEGSESCPWLKWQIRESYDVAEEFYHSSHALSTMHEFDEDFGFGTCIVTLSLMNVQVFLINENVAHNTTQAQKIDQLYMIRSFYQHPMNTAGHVLSGDCIHERNSRRDIPCWGHTYSVFADRQRLPFIISCQFWSWNAKMQCMYMHTLSTRRHSDGTLYNDCGKKTS